MVWVMAQPRIIRRCKENGTVYHVVSRTVNKEFLWDNEAKEVLRKQFRKVAAFCGVEILAHCIMSNHFHLLVKIVTERSASLSNEALFARCQALYTHEKDSLVLARIQASLFGDQDEARSSMRQKLLRRMDDLSMFMKILKQRFSIWINKQRRRWGTHWGERFHSVLVQSHPPALLAVAAYIALNPLRAGICQDPKNYRFSSYTEAVIGHKAARESILFVTGEKNAHQAMSEFRQYMIAVGRLPRRHGEAATVSAALADQVRQKHGNLDKTEIWTTQTKFFCTGLIIGSRSYVDKAVNECQIRLTNKTKPRLLPMESPDSLTCLRL